MRVIENKAHSASFYLFWITEEYAALSLRGAYHTIVLEKVSKKTALFLHFFLIFKAW